MHSHFRDRGFISSSDNHIQQPPTSSTNAHIKKNSMPNATEILKQSYIKHSENALKSFNRSLLLCYFMLTVYYLQVNSLLLGFDFRQKILQSDQHSRIMELIFQIQDYCILINLDQSYQQIFLIIFLTLNSIYIFGLSMIFLQPLLRLWVRNILNHNDQDFKVEKGDNLAHQSRTPYQFENNNYASQGHSSRKQSVTVLKFLQISTSFYNQIFPWILQLPNTFTSTYFIIVEKEQMTASIINLIFTMIISILHAYHDFSYFYLNNDALARRDGSLQMYIFAVENFTLPLVINWQSNGEIALWAQVIFSIARVFDFVKNLPYFNKSICRFYFQLNLMHLTLVTISLLFFYFFTSNTISDSSIRNSSYYSSEYYSMSLFVIILLPIGVKLGTHIYDGIVNQILIQKIEDLKNFVQLDLFVREMIGLLQLHYERYIEKVGHSQNAHQQKGILMEMRYIEHLNQCENPDCFCMGYEAYRINTPAKRKLAIVSPIARDKFLKQYILQVLYDGLTRFTSYQQGGLTPTQQYLLKLKVQISIIAYQIEIQRNPPGTFTYLINLINNLQINDNKASNSSSRRRGQSNNNRSQFQNINGGIYQKSQFVNQSKDEYHKQANKQNTAPFKQKIAANELYKRANTQFSFLFINSFIQNQRLPLMNVLIFDEYLNEVEERMQITFAWMIQFFDLLAHNKINLEQVSKIGQLVLEERNVVESILLQAFYLNYESKPLQKLAKVYGQSLDFFAKPITYYIAAAERWQVQQNQQQQVLQKGKTTIQNANLALQQIDIFVKKSCTIYMTLMNPIGLVKRVSSGVKNMFGLGPETVEGKSINQLMPDSFAEYHNQFLLNFINQGELKTFKMGVMITFGLNNKGFMFQVQRRVKIDYLSPQDIGVVGLFETINSNYQYILTNKYGIVHEITEKLFAGCFKKYFGEDMCKHLFFCQTQPPTNWRQVFIIINNCNIKIIKEKARTIDATLLIPLFGLMINTQQLKVPDFLQQYKEITKTVLIYPKLKQYLVQIQKKHGQEKQQIEIKLSRLLTRITIDQIKILEISFSVNKIETQIGVVYYYIEITQLRQVNDSREQKELLSRMLKSINQALQVDFSLDFLENDSEEKSNSENKNNSSDDDKKLNQQGSRDLVNQKSNCSQDQKFSDSDRLVQGSCEEVKEEENEEEIGKVGEEEQKNGPKKSKSLFAKEKVNKNASKTMEVKVNSEQDNLPNNELNPSKSLEHIVTLGQPTQIASPDYKTIFNQVGKTDNGNKIDQRDSSMLEQTLKPQGSTFSASNEIAQENDVLSMKLYQIQSSRKYWTEEQPIYTSDILLGQQYPSNLSQLDSVGNKKLGQNLKEVSSSHEPPEDELQDYHISQTSAISNINNIYQPQGSKLKIESQQQVLSAQEADNQQQQLGQNQLQQQINPENLMEKQKIPSNKNIEKLSHQDSGKNSGSLQSIRVDQQNASHQHISSNKVLFSDDVSNEGVRERGNTRQMNSFHSLKSMKSFKSMKSLKSQKTLKSSKSMKSKKSAHGRMSQSSVPSKVQFDQQQQDLASQKRRSSFFSRALSQASGFTFACDENGDDRHHNKFSDGISKYGNSKNQFESSGELSESNEMDDMYNIEMYEEDYDENNNIICEEGEEEGDEDDYNYNGGVQEEEQQGQQQQQEVFLQIQLNQQYEKTIKKTNKKKQKVKVKSKNKDNIHQLNASSKMANKHQSNIIIAVIHEKRINKKIKMMISLFSSLLFVMILLVAFSYGLFTQNLRDATKNFYLMKIGPDLMQLHGNIAIGLQYLYLSQVDVDLLFKLSINDTSKPIEQQFNFFEKQSIYNPLFLDEIHSLQKNLIQGYRFLLTQTLTQNEFDFYLEYLSDNKNITFIISTESTGGFRFLSKNIILSPQRSLEFFINTADIALKMWAKQPWNENSRGFHNFQIMNYNLANYINIFGNFTLIVRRNLENSLSNMNNQMLLQVIAAEINAFALTLIIFIVFKMSQQEMQDILGLLATIPPDKLSKTIHFYQKLIQKYQKKHNKNIQNNLMEQQNSQQNLPQQSLLIASMKPNHLDQSQINQQTLRQREQLDASSVALIQQQQSGQKNQNQPISNTGQALSGGENTKLKNGLNQPQKLGGKGFIQLPPPEDLELIKIKKTKVISSYQPLQKINLNVIIAALFVFISLSIYPIINIIITYNNLNEFQINVDEFNQIQPIKGWFSCQRAALFSNLINLIMKEREELFLGINSSSFDPLITQLNNLSENLEKMNAEQILKLYQLQQKFEGKRRQTTSYYQEILLNLIQGDSCMTIYNQWHKFQRYLDKTIKESQWGYIEYLPIKNGQTILKSAEELLSYCNSLNNGKLRKGVAVFLQEFNNNLQELQTLIFDLYKSRIDGKVNINQSFAQLISKYQSWEDDSQYFLQDNIFKMIEYIMVIIYQLMLENAELFMEQLQSLQSLLLILETVLLAIIVVRSFIFFVKMKQEIYFVKQILTLVNIHMLAENMYIFQYISRYEMKH